ncbi:MAG: hypothetical protein WD076_11815 [Parvularculaceae bacterium]
MQAAELESEREAHAEIAKRFVEARLGAAALKTYPGPIPKRLDDGYDIQRRAIELWPDAIAGWKVGRIIGDAEKEFGCDRLAGPIFTRTILQASAANPTRFPVYEGGFAAVEGEFIVVLGKNAPSDKTLWSLAEARTMIGAVVVGVEIASSPFPGINDLGPAVTISDFGNNAGLIIGPEFSSWRDFDFDEWKCEASVGARLIRAGNGASIPGTPIESLRFLLESCARRGMPAKKGQFISTGAVTGVHEIRTGQSARLSFAGAGAIDCIAAPASPERRPRVAVAT